MTHGRQEVPPGPGRKLVRSLASSRTLYWLLPILIALCIVGTLVPQGETPDSYRARFGVWSEPLRFLQLDDLYHGTPFVSVLSLLALNLALCSWQRLIVPGARRDVLLSHVGIIVILAGGMVSGAAGKRGSMPLFEGEAKDSVETPSGSFKLPFAVLLEKFEVEYYGPGLHLKPARIRQFRSDLGVVENGAVVLRKSINVNNPLRWRGYAFYQSGWDPENPRYSNLLVSRDPGTGLVYLGFLLLPAGLLWTLVRSVHMAG